MGASQYMVSASYMIPLMPFLYILISNYLIQEIENREWSQKISKAVLTTVCLVLLIHPVSNVISYEISMAGKNTRYLAKEWIEENIPYNSKILMDSGKSINSFAPMIAENKDSILRHLALKTAMVNKGAVNDTTKMLDKNVLIYYELLLRTVPEESYDITSTMFGMDVKPIGYYLSNKYEYFIISNNMKNSRTNEFFTKRCPEVANFYKSLDVDKRIKLIKTISPSQTNRGGTFYIYEVIT